MNSGFKIAMGGGIKAVGCEEAGEKRAKRYDYPPLFLETQGGKNIKSQPPVAAVGLLQGKTHFLPEASPRFILKLSRYSQAESELSDARGTFGRKEKEGSALT